MLRRVERENQNLMQFRNASAERKRDHELLRAVAVRLTAAANALLNQAEAPGNSPLERKALLLAASSTLAQVTVMVPAVDQALDRLERLERTLSEPLYATAERGYRP